MKKLLAIIMAILMLLSLVSCGDAPVEAVSDDTETTEMVTPDDVDNVEIQVEETSNEVVYVVGWTDEYDDMPYPFGASHEGDPDYYYYRTTTDSFAEADNYFRSYCGGEEFDAWLSEYRNSGCVYTAIDEFANVYSCIKYFDIPEDDAREILEGIGSFTDEEIDLILSDDAEAVAKYFAADTVFRKGKNIYSLCWIYNHSIEDYKECGLTYSDMTISFLYLDNVNFTEEAEEAIDAKIQRFLSNELDKMICSEELKSIVSEYTTLRKLFSTGYMSSSYEMVEVDGHEYYQVTDQRYNTWEEWEAYIRYCFTDELAEEYLNDDLFLNVDGYLYCSTGGIGYPYTDDYTYELLTNGDGVATVRVSIPSAWDDEEPDERILTLVLDEEHWKISDIAYE